MNRLPPLQHPLAALFQRAAQSLTTSLNQEPIRFYHGTIRNFLNFLGAQYPQVQSLPTIAPRSAHPGLVHLLALPPAPFGHCDLYHPPRSICAACWRNWPGPKTSRSGPLGPSRKTHPRPEHYLPRPLTADQDRLIQQELLRRDDRNSNAFLLLRHTGMRIGECADLSFDCLRLVGPDSWAIHVPLGKLKTERLVPVDSFVCRLVDRLRLLRSQDPLPADGFLLARPVAGTRSSASSAITCDLVATRSGSPRALSLTSCDTPSAQRCSVPASASPP